MSSGKFEPRKDATWDGRNDNALSVIGWLANDGQRIEMFSDRQVLDTHRG